MENFKLPQGNGALFACTIDNILTEEECNALIACTEKLGYEPALVHGGSTAVLDETYRKSKRVIIDSFFQR